MANRGFDIRKLTGFSSIAMACFFMLYMPIILLVVYSFNAGTSIAIWEGFSWRWYVSAWDNEMVQEATVRSLIIAVSAAAISTSVAVLAALGTTRTGKFRGQTTVFALIHQPLMVPEIVTAVALLIFFASIKVVTGYTGLMYLIIAHSAFCILHSLRLSADPSAAAGHGPDPRTGGGGSLWHAVSGFSPCDPAPALAGHPRRGDAGLCH
jgi:spermidine/putrescine transport system permease protein